MGELSGNFKSDKLVYINLSTQSDFVVDVDGILLGTSGLLKIVKGVFDTGNTCISIPNQYSSQIT